MNIELKIADGISLPSETVTQAIGILAKRRAGKSFLARRLVEQIFRCGQQVVIVDPKGDWWGVRSSRDGNSAGLAIPILGGEHGDIRVEPSGGESVARLAVEERVSLLLDLSDFRKYEVATFMAAFLETLYRLKAHEQYRTAMNLVIDEADAIAPQKPQKGEERMLGAAEDIVRRGGQRGIGCTMITQRSAVLNKNVLTQVELLIALRTIAPQDLAAVQLWIDVHGTVEGRKILMETLPALPVGDAWFWSPGWPTDAGIFERAHVYPIETFDSFATPRPGEQKAVARTLADVDLKAFEKTMAETIERTKQNNPVELRRRIAELEKSGANAECPDKAWHPGGAKLADHLAQAVNHAVAAALEKESYSWAGIEITLTEFAESARKLCTEAAHFSNRIEDVLKRVHADREASRDQGFPGEAAPFEAGPLRLEPNQGKTASDFGKRFEETARADEGDGTLGVAETSIMSALLAGSLTSEQLHLITGRKDGGSWRTTMKKLRDSNLVEAAADGFRLTHEGVRVAKRSHLTPLMPTFSKMQVEILDHLDAMGPLNASQLWLLTGYSDGGAWRTALSHLRTLNLIRSGSNGYETIIGPQAWSSAWTSSGRSKSHRWLSALSGIAIKALDTLRANPRGLTAKGLMELSGYHDGGAWRTAMSQLRTANLIETRDGLLHVSEEVERWDAQSFAKTAA